MTTQEKLEALFAKVRALPEPAQLEVLELLTDVTAEEPLVLSDEDRALLEPLVEDAKRGVNLIDLEDCEILNKPWR